MKYASMLLLLCSYVSAKDINLADYPITFHVDTMVPAYSSRVGCVMGLSTERRSYVARDLLSHGCFHAGTLQRGAIIKVGGEQLIEIVYEHKGKLKRLRYNIDVETAY